MSVILGDCLDVMAAMEPESVDAIVTDPPYGLEFMGKEWDRGVPGLHFWQEMWRVAKPSSYLLSFGGTRTVHRIASNIEDAGWIIRDMLVWGYASGFPKSKASLKPAWEPIVMARKPGPLRMLAIDECRIGYASEADRATTQAGVEAMAQSVRGQAGKAKHEGWARPWMDDPEKVAASFAAQNVTGRWPANIVLTDAIFDGGIEGVVGGGEATTGGSILGDKEYADIGYHGNLTNRSRFDSYGDTGTYSRFFLIPKAARSDREPVLGRAFPQGPIRGEADYMPYGVGDNRPSGSFHERLNDPPVKPRANVHPTVKPVDLMRHLVRLVTPTGGTVLDPFLGSGTTGLAAEMEGFAWIGIEREAEYVAIAEARLNGTQKGMAL